MAAIEFYLYPDGDFSFSPNAQGSGTWSNQPTYSKVDDPQASPNDSDYGDEAPISSVVTWAAEWNLTPPQSAVTITSIELFARVWAPSNNSTTHDLTNVKGITNPGGGSTRYLGSGQTIVGTTGAQGPNPQLYSLGTRSTNPATSTSWTIPDLQALVCGIQWDDQDFGSSSPRGIISQFFVKVLATTTAASIEAERAIGTHFLREFRVPTGIVEVVNLPPQFADADLLDDVAVSHFGGPAPWGKWGEETWSRRDCILLSKAVNPATYQVTWRALDARPYRCSLWFSPYHDLGYTEEGRGVPYIDLGGGRTISRNQKAYVLKSADDTLYAEVPVDKEKWDPLGWRVEGGSDVNRLLNSSFSQGSGSTFTNWTPTAGGTGSIAEDTTNYLFDASGLRRAAVLSQGSSGTEVVAQTTGSTADAYVRARAIGNQLATASSGSGVVFFRIQRSSDSKYWNDGAGTWDVTTISNVLSNNVVGKFDWISKLIPTSGTNTYTCTVGFLVSGNGGQVVLQEVELRTGTQVQMNAVRSPLVTTSATVTRTVDTLTVRNDSSVRWWDPTVGGTIILRLKTLWDHNDLADGAVKAVLGQTTTGSRTEKLFYLRTNSGTGEWIYQRFDGSSAYFARVVVNPRPTYLSDWKLAFRWVGPDNEFNLGVNNLSIFANGNKATGSSVAQTIGGTVDALVGMDGTNVGDVVIQSLESTGFCLSDEEILRRLG